MNQLYVLSREGYDDYCDLMYFMDRESAMNELIRFAVSTKKVGVIYVYEHQDTSAHFSYHNSNEQNKLLSWHNIVTSIVTFFASVTITQYALCVCG